MSDPSRPSTRVCSLLPDLGLVHSDRCMWSSASGQRLYPIILFSGFLLGVVPPQSSSFAVWADEGGLSKTSKYPLTKLHSPPEFWTERCQMGVPGDLWKVLVLWGLLEHWPFCSSQGRHTLPVLWIMPFTDDPGCGNITEATLPAVHLAQQHLRKQPAPLCNYELEIHLVNSQVILNSISSAFALSFVVNSDLYVQNKWCVSVDYSLPLSLLHLELNSKKYMPLSTDVCQCIFNVILYIFSVNFWPFLSVACAIPSSTFNNWGAKTV